MTPTVSNREPSPVEGWAGLLDEDDADVVDAGVAPVAVVAGYIELPIELTI
jgi:hypothetical protein